MSETTTERTQFLRDARPEAAGPRFHIRFEEGRGFLELANEVPRTLFVLKRAKLALSRVKFPIAVGGGASRFRTRHTHLRQIEIDVPLGGLLDAANARGVALRVHGADAESGYACSLSVDGCVVSFRAHVFASGTQVMLAVLDEHRVVDDTTTAWQRVASAMFELGAEFDEERGVFVWSDALPAMLRDALCRHGWKLPDSRATHLEATPVSLSSIRIQTREDGTASTAVGRVRDAARGLSDARVRLLSGDHEGALEALALVPATHPAAADAHNLASRIRFDLGEHVAASALTRDDLRLRQAIRDGRAIDAALFARDLDAQEPVPEIAAQALYAAAVSQPHDAGAVRAELLERALARDASDARIAHAALDAFLSNNDRGAIERLARALVPHARSSEEHAAVLRDVALAHRDFGAAARAHDLVRFVLEAHPSDARAWALLAELAKSSDLETALDAYDRAAALFGDAALPREAARMHAEAADVAHGAGREHLALDLAEKARALDPRNVAFAVRSAELAAALGIHVLARDALSQVLKLGGDERSVPGLRLGADYYSAVRDPAALRPFIDALERHVGTDAEVQTRRDELRRTFTDVWVDDPSRVPLPTQSDLEAFGSRARTPSEAAESLLHVVLDRSDLGDEQRMVLLRTARSAASRAGDPDLTSRVVSAVAKHASIFADAAELESLETLAGEGATVSLLARRAAEIYKEAGDMPRHALALGRAGIAANDSQLIRAAIETAQRASAWSDAIDLVDSALRLVGDGPARMALLARRAEFESQARAERD